MAEETPPPYAERRQPENAGARVIIQRLDALEKELATMRVLLAGFVTFRGVLGASLGILLAAGGFGAFFLTRAEAASREAGKEALAEARAARAEVRETVAFMRTELQDARREQKADMAELKAEVRNASRVVERTAKRAAVASDGGP